MSLLVRTSPIEGDGVFAGANIAPGEVIDRVNVIREVTAATPLNLEAGERADHCAYQGSRVFLWGEPHCRLNHSCDPNAYESHIDGNVFLVSSRLIAKGDEITLDYNINLSGGEPWDCRCGAERCLGKPPDDYVKLPTEIRLEYQELLQPWFRRLHARRLSSPLSQA